jgi:hypothetical protein
MVTRKNYLKAMLGVGLCSVCLLAGPSQAASIFTNPITDSNPSASNPYTTGQTVSANLTVSGIGRGSGLSGNTGSGRYNATSWSLSSLDANDYFTWTLTPNSGFEIDLNSFVYTGQRSTTGPSSFAFRSSLDSFASNIGSPSATGATISLSAASFQNITAPITFRLYAWGGSNAAGTFSVNDFTFDGSISPLVIADIDPASTSTIFPARLVGSVATQAVTLNVTGTASYTSSTSGSAVVTAGASGGPITGPATGSITVGITTATAGHKTGAVTLNDGNADVDQIAVSGDVLDHANVVRVGSGPIDLGIFDLNAGDGSVTQTIEDLFTNLVATAGFTATADRDQTTETSDVDGKFALLALFDSLAAGALGDVQITLDTTTAGIFEATYHFSFSDGDAYIGASLFGSQTADVTFIAQIIPEPMSALLLTAAGLLLGGRRTRRRA